MKTVPLIICVVLGLSILTGCNGAAAKKDLLSVDFQKGQVLRYKFVSSRNISVNWSQTKGDAQQGKSKVDKSSESMELVVSYEPVEVDPYGLTNLKATCESVKVKRTSHDGRQVTQSDAIESLTGKTFTFNVGPTGKIYDYSQLKDLILEAGKKAFRPDSRQGKVKEPDMIDDFIATQWFLWDSVSSMEKVTEGVSAGKTWKSELSVPTSMVLRKARDVTYTLEEIQQTEKGRLAVIKSSYFLAGSVPPGWPMPYPDGSFQMSGTFGFLRNYKVLDLQGQGEELFNIDAGRTEQYTQKYQMNMEASLLLALGVNPLITVEQTLTMQLLDSPVLQKERKVGTVGN